MEQDHSRLHRVINVLVQNSIEWYIARYTNSEQAKDKPFHENLFLSE